MESFYSSNTPSPSSMAHTLQQTLKDSGIKLQLHQVQSFIAKMLNHSSFESLSVQYKAHQKEQSKAESLRKKMESTFVDGLRYRAMQIDPAIKKNATLGVMSINMDYYRLMDPDYEDDYKSDYFGSMDEFKEAMEDSCRTVALPRGFMMVSFGNRYVVVDTRGLPPIDLNSLNIDGDESDQK